MYDEGIGAWPDKHRLKSLGSTALVFDEREFTYARFADRADRIASCCTRARRRERATASRTWVRTAPSS